MARAASDIANSVVRTGGLVLVADLRAAGLSQDEVKRVVRGLHKIRRGAYAVSKPRDEIEWHVLLTRAVVLNHARFVAASHLSAAVLHGLPLWQLPLDAAHVTGLRRARRGIRHGVHTHEGSLLDPEIVEIGDISVTSVPRTVVDCALTLPLDRAVAITDAALHLGLADADELTWRQRRLPPVAGIDRVARVLSLADGRAESPGESRTRLLLVQHGFEVEPQVVVHDERGRFVGRVDLKLVGCDVAVEFDGRAKYSLSGDVEQAHWDEKQRHDALNDVGLLVVRVTWQQLEQPAVILARVRKAMTRARRLAG